MNEQIEIKRTDDGALFARRLDGKPLTDADREEARRLAATNQPSAVGVDIIDDAVVAVLIDSTVLGRSIWLAFRSGWHPGEGDTSPIVYASELPALREKTAEQLQRIFNIVKPIFGGGMVLQ